MPSDADALLRLSLVPGLGPITASRLLAAVDSPQEVFGLGMQRLQAIDGVGGKRARAISDPSGWDQVVDERANCFAAGVTICTRADPEYPRFLEKLSDPPLAIWLQGAFERRDEVALAVVGPRRPSAYGHRLGGQFCRRLAGLGICIVSGLAKGIDTVAHEAALQAGGRTVAVLGSGFGKLYPAENRALAQQIADGRGCVLSEYPLHTAPSPGTFPRRNRLVAALSLATLVIEASNRSGALITARLCNELGQEVLVLPGPIDRPEHAGSNQLIRDGATLVTSVDDILEEVSPFRTLANGLSDEGNSSANSKSAGNSLNERERTVYNLLCDDPRSADDIVRVSSLPASAVTVTLVTLEIRKLIRKTPGGYVRAC